MGYLIGEILICLILAALIGAVIAWLLRGVRCRSRENELLDELKQTHSKVDSAEGELRRQEASLVDLRSEFESQVQALKTRDEELSTVKASLVERDERIAALESELAMLRDEKEVEITSLREHIGTLEPLQGQLDESQTERNRLQGELQVLKDSMQAEVQKLNAELSSTTSEKEAELERLRAELEETAQQLHTEAAERDTTIERLESDLRAASDQEKRALKKQLAESKDRPKAAEVLPAGQLFKRPAESDDLKKVWGIGPKLEKTLNRLGITTFAQIARFTADDIERVSHALDFFPGRIIRDGWTDGAAKEHYKKYGKKLDG